MALAEELGIPRLACVGNKASLPEDSAFFAEVCAEYGVPLAGVVPDHDQVASADRLGTRLQPPSGEYATQSRPLSISSSPPRPRRSSRWPRKRASNRRLAELTAVR